MDPVIGKIVTSVGKTVARRAAAEPDKALSGLAKVLIVIMLVLVFFVTALLSSLAGCLDGAWIGTVFEPTKSEKYCDIKEDYDKFMTDLYENMAERKQELLKQYTETIEEQISVWVEGHWEIEEIPVEDSSGETGNTDDSGNTDESGNIGDSADKGERPGNSSGAVMTPFGPEAVSVFFTATAWNVSATVSESDTETEETVRYEKKWVEGYWKTETVKRDVATARVFIKMQEVDIAYIMAYVTVTEEGVLKKWLSWLIPDTTVKDFLTEITFLQEEERELSEEEQKNADGDEKYLTKEIIIYNEVLCQEEILETFFPEDNLERKMFELSYNLYHSLMQTGD